ncbi:hypothetical protein VF14_08445 [Nostoc linckia z18]|uniref:Uncharacterized protein n=2 Tax=Nostoc linckia TaxID=92942 RepID=A0A9Q5ZCY2_NOSLI|nr:hypothetical protein [Nostoc linckia]PHK39135.1 hypothetical protein VF12_15545 [Nostoc linckia z15]PHK45588.1 hypothetical protein VF13_15560 [Nostoc linckia z16]PHJ64589.1 hypothetical protein VF02_12585 [Nostoc linckia z1]PHJ69940.1 hypothetical protein VF05_12240 [Nostoc linckia z3]PHJ73015.1 hypothetical protein VF03_17560 [Nostoc linckia z2]
MNKTILSVLMFVFLLLFITSPFAALAGLMFILLAGTCFYVLGNLFQAIIGGDANVNKLDRK